MPSDSLQNNKEKKLRCDATETNGLSVTVMTISKNSLSETSSSGLALL